VTIKSDKEILVEARNLIADPSKWVRGNLALDDDGKTLGDGYDPRACKWCALGALGKALGKGEYQRFRYITLKLDRVAEDLSYGYAATLNDESNHDTVLRMFDIAISKESE
jgi:hypothetical protein